MIFVMSNDRKLNRLRKSAFAPYTPKNLPVKPSRLHKDKKLHCSGISMNELQFFYGSFYAVADKVKQDLFILKHLVAVQTKRHRPRSNSMHYKPREMQRTYKIYL